MRNKIQIKNDIPSIGDSHHHSPWRCGFLLIVLVFAAGGLAISPQARAACQEGCGAFNNTFLGDDALINTTSGENTAIGFNALYNNTTGVQNTANGCFALFSNTTGFGNTADGFSALFSDTTGANNTANGFGALENNKTGNSNTATGLDALYHNTIGDNNTANGFFALDSNTTGTENTAEGYNALFNNTTGTSNTASGSNALIINTTGSSNIALGASAGSNLTTGSNNIDIVALGVAGESNTMRLGKKGLQKNTYVAGISGVTVAGGVAVIIDTAGHLGTVVSSERFKDNIQPMAKSSEAILSLKPVTFRYKKELDPDAIPQFGLVAEQVEKVNPDLVARDEQGNPYTVRYEAVNAMLLNEFLKEHRKVEKLEATIAQLKTDETNLKATVALQQNTNAEQQKEIQALSASLKEQAALIQKVSDQLEPSKSAPRVVANDQ